MRGNVQPFAVAGVVVAIAMLLPIRSYGSSCVALLAARPHRDTGVDVTLQNGCDGEIHIVHCQSKLNRYACPSFNKLPAHQTGTFLFMLYPLAWPVYPPPPSYLAWCMRDNCETGLGDSFRESGGNPKSLGDFIPLSDGTGKMLSK